MVHGGEEIERVGEGGAELNSDSEVSHSGSNASATPSPSLLA